MGRLIGRIVIVYFVFGFLWILFSDSLLLLVAKNAHDFQRLSTYKGWAYIFITTALLYLLIRKSMHQQVEIENSLLLSEERWKFALEGAGEGVWDWNLQTQQVFRSSRWHQIYGYDEDEVGPTAQDGRKLIHPDDLQHAVDEIDAHLRGDTPLFVSEFRLRCKDGSWKWTLSRGMVVRTADDGRPLRMIGTHTDITERKQAETQIFRLAHYDAVTGLPNRVLFQDRFARDIRQAVRDKSQVVLMYLDLDRFKEVNDTLGHDVGDLLLREAGARLAGCLRATDTVARIGGDEFTVVLADVRHGSAIEQLAQSILDRLAEPFQLGNESLYISASIGISLYPADGESVETLLKNADQAMYEAKRHGRNCYHYFTPAMQQAAIARLRTANDLRAALADGQFILHYQPIVELATGRIRKAEALVRWLHPGRGLVSPAEFIPVAEDTGLIVELGEYVFRQAAAMVRQWRAADPAFQVSINKSPVQFRSRRCRQEDWLGYLDAIGLSADAVVLEVTEGLLFGADAAEVRQLADFRRTGMQIAIDDFGTGYSSLAYIKKFDIDYVKIDQSFTQNLEADSDQLVLCEAIIVMSHKLGIQVVAEGVETARQRDLLRQVGCDYAQGYFFARPLPPEEFAALLDADTAD